nr:unnamed protein product [Digitaria exilis]
MRVAVVGAGLSGLAAAHELARSGEARVTVYEKEDHLGGHGSKTMAVEDGGGGRVHVDLGSMMTCPNMTKWFEELGVEVETSDMSFSASTRLNKGGGFEWGNRNVSGVLVQKSNLLSPRFWLVIREIFKFKNDVLEYLEDHGRNPDWNETLGQFIQSHRYSQLFQDAYLIPMCACIWSSPAQGVLGSPALSVLSFFHDNHLLELFGRPQWHTVKGGSGSYVNKVRGELESMGCQIKTGCEVKSVSKFNEGISKAQILLNIESSRPFLVTFNPPHVPNHVFLKWHTSHPIPSVAAAKATLEFNNIQGKRGIWFCGPYQGYRFYEDSVKIFFGRVICLWHTELIQAGKVAASELLRRKCELLVNPKPMVLSWTEAGARLLVAKTFERHIIIGNVSILEEGGTAFSFGKACEKCNLKSVIQVHDPKFYWKLVTEADLGFAYAYINGYISFVDSREGLLNLILSNDFFALYLDPSMTYSSAIFKAEDESLEAAQLRKHDSLISKAKVESWHHVLDIGSGWGTLAIRLVKKTGCKYTGITLSEEQLKYSKQKVKEAGLEDNITLLLCDYRQIPTCQKFDRIISCEMIEHVGHEYMDDFFGACEYHLAEHGLFVLQFITIPEDLYAKMRVRPEFIKEYIFPGGCLPSLSRVVSAMTNASSLCVQHLENIGDHYYPTLMHWRDNFLANRKKVSALGFDETFIRTWEYYLTYCAAMFKSRTIMDYQMVFARPGDAKLPSYLAIE